ncbi:MAG: nucleoid-associated protein [Saprospiraceae bacterium]
MNHGFFLHHLAIHELIKQPDQTEAVLRLSDRLLPADEKAVQLVGKLHKTFSSKNEVLSGVLAPPEDALFPGYFQVMQESRFAESAFLQFSRETMQALQLGLQGVTAPKAAT